MRDRRYVRFMAHFVRARLNDRIHCRSRREEAQISDDLAKNQSLLTSAPTILGHALSNLTVTWRHLSSKRTLAYENRLIGSGRLPTGGAGPGTHAGTNP